MALKETKECGVSIENRIEGKEEDGWSEILCIMDVTGREY
jgi:hypothetical protein